MATQEDLDASCSCTGPGWRGQALPGGAGSLLARWQGALWEHTPDRMRCRSSRYFKPASPSTAHPVTHHVKRTITSSCQHSFPSQTSTALFPFAAASQHSTSISGSLKPTEMVRFVLYDVSTLQEHQSHTKICHMLPSVG